MRYLIKRFVFTGVALMLFLFSPVRAYAGATDWIKYSVDQTKVGRGSGCTTVSLLMLLMNSGVLNTDNQIKAGESTNQYYLRLDGATNGKLHRGDGWTLGGFIDTANSISESGVTWVSANEGDSVGYAKGVSAIVGFGGKLFSAMDKSEVTSTLKTFYNGGYHIIVAVTYDGAEASNNGVSGYKANHATMFAGADEKDFYLNDPSYGKVNPYSSSNFGGHAYRVKYVLLFRANKGGDIIHPAKTWSGIGGGTAPAPITETDVNNIQNATGTTASQAEQIAKGYFSEEQLGSYFKLGEASIHDLYLGNALRDNLTQENITTLSNWQRNIQSSDSELGYVSYLRIAVSFLGVVLCIYGALLYLGYWFDRLNTLIQLEMLSVLTFGRLHAVNEDGDSNWALDKSGIKRVTHGQIIFISLLSMGFGTLLMTGTFYRVVTAFVNLVMRWLN